MLLRGTIQNGQVVLDEPLSIPEGTQVRVSVVEPSSPPPPVGPRRQTLQERLLVHAGTVPGLPEDFAENHDHYVHGTPKR